jgi:hypothetical protein
MDVNVVLTVSLAIIALINGIVLWILSDIVKRMRESKQDFTAKIDRVVQFYQDQRSEDRRFMEAICQTANNTALKVKELEVIYKIVPYLKDNNK